MVFSIHNRAEAHTNSETGTAETRLAQALGRQNQSMQGGRYGHIVSPFYEELLAFESCQERQNQYFFNGVTSILPHSMVGPTLKSSWPTHTGLDERRRGREKHMKLG